MADLVPGTPPPPPPFGTPTPTPTSAMMAVGSRHVGEGEPEAIDLKESFGVIRRRLWLIVGITAVVVAFTGWRLKNQDLRYQATAVIRLVDQRRALAGNLDNSTSPGMGGYWTDPIASELQVLRSRAVGDMVVDSEPLGLRVQVSGFPAYALRDVSLDSDQGGDSVVLDFGRDGIVARVDSIRVSAAYGAPVHVDGLSFVVSSRPAGVERGVLYTIPRRSAVDLLLGGLHASQRERTDVVDVSYTATDPYVAQQVVNAVVREFQREDAAQAQQESRRRRIFVQAQLEQTDSLLRIAQDRLAKYRADKKVYGSADAVVTAEQTGLLNVEMQRQDLVATRQVYQSLLDGLHRPSEDGRRKALRALIAAPGVADNPVVQADYQQLVTYQGALDSMSVGKYGSAPTNPDVKRVTSQIGESERRLGDAVGSQITMLDARVAALDELKQRSSEALDRLPATQAGEARLVEQVQATSTMADQLRSEYQKARIAEAVEAGEVELVDMATYPYAPIGTSRRTKLLTGGIVGLLLGLGAAFLAERLNTAIRRREDIESVLQVPGLAIIPQIVPARLARLRVGRLSVPVPPGINIPQSRRPRRDTGSLVTVSASHSTSAEAFRTLRTNLIFSQAVQTLRTLVVTSPSPQDGKTTTAANLAVTFAQQGMRVVIVDCDLRRARLHQLFRQAREPGLTHLLLGQKTPREVVRSTMVENLSLLPAGGHPPNPSELLGGQRMRDVLAQLQQEFDVVILDTPPVHAAADPLILGSMSDGVILVLRAGHTEKTAAQDAVQRLSAVNVRVVGAVLNDPDHKVPQYGGYYYYYDYKDGAEA